MLLILKAKIANMPGFHLLNGRWHRLSPELHGAGAQHAGKHLTDDEWGQLYLPSDNANSRTHNPALQRLRAMSEAGDIGGILSQNIGTNTYGKRYAKIANHLLDRHGVADRVTPGQKAGQHPAVLNKKVQSKLVVVQKDLFADGSNLSNNKPINKQNEVGKMKEVQKISYTVSTSVAGPLSGKTLTGGVPAFRVVAGKAQDVVVFDTAKNGFDPKAYGQEISVRTNDKPDLAAAAKAYAEEKAAAFEAALPGITEILSLAKKVGNDSAKYAEQFNRMMESENNDGVRPPKQPDVALETLLQEKLAANPRAAQYLRAEGFEHASNYMKAAAGTEAKKMLLDGASAEEAKATLDDWTGEKAKAAKEAADNAALRSAMTLANGWDVVNPMPEFFSAEWKALQAKGYKMYMLGKNGQPVENSLNGTVMAKPVA